MRNEGEVIANKYYIISINKLKDTMGRNAINEQQIVSLATCEVKRKKKTSGKFIKPCIRSSSIDL